VDEKRTKVVGLMRVKTMNEIHRQNIPELFLEIMRFDLDEPPVPVSHAGVALDFDVWRRWKSKHDVWKGRRQYLTQKAEIALSWNKDKGNPNPGEQD
jgi:hypothetical protein